ncbi:penicillin-binding protein 2, partial [Haemophilus influenzae HK1212]
LVVTVILENAGGGSSNAAPLARKVMDYYLNQRLPQVEKYNEPIQQKKDLSQESEQINGR